MSNKGSKLVLALVVVLMTLHSAWAQNTTCTSAFLTLSPCLQRINLNSTRPTKPTKPSASCCSSLGGILQSQPECMCMLINGGGPAAGIAMSQSLAMALPAACNIQNPPVSQCDTPVASPPSSPVPVVTPPSDSTPTISPSSDTPDDSDTDTPSTTGPGSKLFPWLNRPTSDAITIKSSLPITVLLLFITSILSKS